PSSTHLSSRSGPVPRDPIGAGPVSLSISNGHDRARAVANTWRRTLMPQPDHRTVTRYCRILHPRGHDRISFLLGGRRGRRHGGCRRAGWCRVSWAGNGAVRVPLEPWWWG